MGFPGCYLEGACDVHELFYCEKWLMMIFLCDVARVAFVDFLVASYARCSGKEIIEYKYLKFD